MFTFGDFQQLFHSSVSRTVASMRSRLAAWTYSPIALLASGCVAYDRFRRDELRTFRIVAVCPVLGLPLNALCAKRLDKFATETAVDPVKRYSLSATARWIHFLIRSTQAKQCGKTVSAKAVATRCCKDRKSYLVFVADVAKVERRVEGEKHDSRATFSGVR